MDKQEEKCCKEGTHEALKVGTLHCETCAYFKPKQAP